MFGLWLFLTITISVFAYQFTDYADIWDVSSWQALSKDTFNQLLADVRYLKNNQGLTSIWPAFRAWISTVQTFNTADKIINWERLDFDTNNNFDLVNNRFLPTKAGKYNVSCNLRWSNMWGNSSTSMFINIYKNWVIYSRICVRYWWTVTSSSISTTVDMNWTTDYVDCRISDGSDDSWSINSNAYLTWFEWYYIWN